MDLSKLSVKHIDGYERPISIDGMTQKDKILPYMTIVYPYRGFYEVALGDDPLSCLPAGAGCFMTAPGVRHTIVHRITPGEADMVPRWLRLSVMYDHVLDVTSWFEPPLLVTGEQARPFIEAIDELNSIRVSLQKSTADAPTRTFQRLRIAGAVLENLLQVCRFRPAELEMERIYPAIVLVKDHYDKRLTVEQMAAECGMSASTFYRAFRQIIQKTPMQYLDEYRLKQAAQMLIFENETLSNIAVRCGFYDEFHLSRNFKSCYGMSPREYKKRTIL